jgi:DnaJ-class molecular chaperone
MNHAEMCPVCQGTGRIPEENWSYVTEINEILCHGCNGRGWVVVDDNMTYTNRYYNPEKYVYNRY